MSGTYQKPVNKIQCGTSQPLILKTGLPIALIIAGVLAYSNSFRGTFILDDEPGILKNPYISHLWPLSKAMSAPAQSTGAARPIANLSLAVNYAVGGYSVRGYHFFNLTVHILAGLALYGIIRRTLLSDSLREKFGNYSTTLAWAAATIWLVHPVQTESVTYIIQRTESLMGLFYLLTLYFAARAMESHRPLLWSAASVICCCLGMGTKEVMVTAPVLVLLYDRAFAAGSFGAALRRRWGLYAGMAASWGILAALIWSGPRSLSTGFSIGYSPLDYALNQCIVILHYLRLVFWPSKLCLVYGWPVVNDWGRIFSPMLAILAILAVTAWGVVHNRNWAYPAVWFFVILLPTSSFVPIADLAFEHRMYLPSAGVIVLAVTAGYVLLERLLGDRDAKRTGIILAMAVVGVLTWLTLLRNNDYRSAVSIWRTVLDVVPSNSRVHNNLGSALVSEGKLDEAIDHFRQASQLNPNGVDILYNFGLALYSQGKIDEAIGCFRRALQLRPDAEIYYSLGYSLQTQGNFNQAIDNYRQTLKLDPNFAEAHYNLGYALQQQGRLDEAVSHYRQALRINPNHTGAAKALQFPAGKER